MRMTAIKIKFGKELQFFEAMNEDEGDKTSDTDEVTDFR